MKRFILLSLLSLMILCILLPDKSFPWEDGNIVIDVESSTLVKNESVAEARTDAIQRALQKAVEQATGNLLTPQILEGKAKTLRENIFLKADQYIQNYRIISEKAYAGTHTVIVRVTLSLDGIKDDIRSLGLGKELSPGLPSAPVVVTIRGIKNYLDYAQFREFLKTGLKGVDGIHPRTITWGTATMDVNIRGGIAVMAAELAKVKQFPIKATIAGNNAIDVVFSR